MFSLLPMPLYTALIMKRTATMRLRLLLLPVLLVCLGAAFPQRLQAQTEVAKLQASDKEAWNEKPGKIIVVARNVIDFDHP